MSKVKPLNSREISTFCSQTAIILKAGITPVEGMGLLRTDAATSEARAIYDQIFQVCSGGNSFYDGVEATGVFPDYVLNMISLGEASGNLDSVLSSLADYYHREEQINSSIKDAVRYPFVMALMMLAIIIVLITKVLPIFEQVFHQLGTELSPVALGLMSIGEKLRVVAVVLLGILVVGMALYFILRHNAKGRKTMTSVLSKFGITKELYDTAACERFASGMSMALASGLDTFQALDLTSHLADHPGIQEKIQVCKTEVRAGSTFPEALQAAGMLNAFYIRMISIGWKTGNPDVVMHNIAGEYEEKNTRKLQFFISIIEPALVIVLSIVIGMILLSVILPLLGVMSSIG